MEEIENLTSEELTSLADADLELTGRTFGHSDGTIVFGELDGEGFYVREKEREVLSTPTSFKEKANRRPSKTTVKPPKWVSSSCAQMRLQVSR
jgi:hypothetical protein